MSSLEINVDTRDFARLQATLTQMGTEELDRLLRSTVNAVGTKADRMIRQQVASELGIPESFIKHRLILNKSDSRPHTVRSSWLWFGKHRLSGTRIGRVLGTQFTRGQVRVGKYLWRDGFWGPGHSAIEGVLMQRVNGAGRYPIKAAMVDVSSTVQKVIDRISPIVPALLERELEAKLDKYLQTI